MDNTLTETSAWGEPIEPEGTTTYERAWQGWDTTHDGLRKAQRGWQATSVMLFVIVVGLGYGLHAQMKLPKQIPYVAVVDQITGETVPRFLARPEELPSDTKESMSREWLEREIRNFRFRSIDKAVTSGGIKEALRGMAGPGLDKARASLWKEEVWKRLEKESVAVEMPRLPVFLAGETWQAEWTEVVTGRTGKEERVEFVGTFQLAEQPDWVAARNLLGLRVVGWTIGPKGK